LIATAYDIRGLDARATDDELHAAYAARLAEYAPERLAGAAEEFHQLAAQRRMEIHSAFQALRATRAAPQQLEPQAERRRDRETILALLVMVLLALAVPLARGIAVPSRTVAATAAGPAASISDGAPDFTAQTLDGQTVRLSDFRGRVVLLNFWATWCPPCVREIPRLVRVADAYKNDGLVVLGLNTTFQDDRAKVEQFTREQGISYPVLLDPDGVASEKYPARLMPTTVLIDRQGQMVHIKVGEVDEATLMEQVKAALQE